ncbi:MAG: hypothetical protein JSU86_03135 [Phycisphaerales bacterium]|nr:MAG: hypothetical protein JSU86_03135 [Phycisphaerales bacterium]
MFRPPDKYRRRDEIDHTLRATINELIRGERPWPLFLYGKQGSGKTCAGLCMMDAFGGWYIQLAQLREMVIQAQKDQLTWPSGHPRTTGDIWKAWARAHLAVLDEVGQRCEPSQFEYEILKRCLDEREGKPLVVVSNCDLDAISGLYDDRIASRLAAGTLIELEGDRRIEKKLKVVGV